MSGISAVSPPISAQPACSQPSAMPLITCVAVATSSFVDALNHITTIAAVIALVAGVLCLVLIRAKDFEGHHGAGPAPRPEGDVAQETSSRIPTA